MKLFLAVIFCQALLLALAVATPVVNENDIYASSGSPYPMMIVYLGVAGPKSYFAEVNTTMAWAAASTHCQRASLKLATIDTANQYTILTAALRPYVGEYWTAGRESRLPSAYTWNGTDTQLDNVVVQNFQGGNFSPTTDKCVTLNSQGNTYPRLCNATTYLVICES